MAKKDKYNSKNVNISRKPIIAIDFDDTIAENSWPTIAKAKLKDGADVYIKKLKEELECEIIIWTCRYMDEHVQDAKDFLKKHDIPYDYFNENSDKLDFKPEPKIYYDLIIDDKHMIEVDWPTIYKFAMLKIIGDRSDDVTNEMIQFYWDRTQRHIDLVNKYAKQFEKSLSYPEHDMSKFSKEMLVPYILKTWSKRNPDFEWTAKMQKEDIRATEAHILSEKHHPEYWANVKEGILDPNNRDKAQETLKIKDMPEEYIVELCCDWCAVSEEMGTKPQGWADMQLGNRWDFGQETHSLIYEILNDIWGKDTWG